MEAEAELYNVGNGIKVDFEAGRLFPGDAVYHGKLGRENVAVKMVSQDVSEWNRVEREIANMIKLESHKNTVQYKASSSTRFPPNFYIAMEKCRSGTLENVVEEGKLTLQNQKIAMQHIINGLQHMHEHGILHRMLEPKHILQSLDGKHAKICGFGLSRVDGNAPLSLSTQSTGDWGSPEVYSEKQLDEKSDVFSAGLIFHYVSSEGKHPFGNESLSRKLHIMNGEKMKFDLKQHPHRLVATNLIQRMLSFQQSDRPATSDVLRHPFFWDEERQKGCVAIVRQFLQPAEVMELLHDQYVNDEDGSLMVYILAHLQEQGIQIPEELRTEFDEMMRPQPKYRQLEDIDFEQSKSTERRSGAKRACNAATENQEPTNDILETELCKIYTAKRYKSGKLVFAGEIKGVVEDPAAVKIMPNTEESLQIVKILQEIKDHQNIVVMKQHFEMTMDAKDVVVEGLHEGEKYICVAMEPCETSLTEALKSNPSAEYRKMLALHLIHALEFLQETKIVHRQIAMDKIFLSKDKRNLKLIGWRKSSKEPKWVLNEDIKAAADVLKAIVGRDSLQEVGMQDDHHLFDHLYEEMSTAASASEILLHPFFWKPNKKLDFLCSVGDQFDAREDNSVFENFIRCCCDQDWTEILKLKDAEKAQWFTDDDGIVYQKAIAMKNRKTPKYDSSSPTCLIRLIRNCANHLLDDCIKERRDHNYTEQQKLFRNRKDIWIFFAPRYPQLLCLVYRYIQDSELRQEHRFTRFFTEPAAKTTLNKVIVKKEQ